MFLRYQIGVGFALLLLGIVSVFVFAGLVHRLQFDTAAPSPTEKPTAAQIAGALASRTSGSVYRTERFVSSIGCNSGG
jgi:hypothetical protein